MIVRRYYLADKALADSCGWRRFGDMESLSDGATELRKAMRIGIVIWRSIGGDAMYGVSTVDGNGDAPAVRLYSGIMSGFFKNGGVETVGRW